MRMTACVAGRCSCHIEYRGLLSGCLSCSERCVSARTRSTGADAVAETFWTYEAWMFKSE